MDDQDKKLIDELTKRLERRKQKSPCDECPACESTADTEAYCDICECLTCKCRNQPDIGAVLDEIEGQLRQRGVYYGKGEGAVDYVRTKYSTPVERLKPFETNTTDKAPEPEKATLTKITERRVE